MTNNNAPQNLLFDMVVDHVSEKFDLNQDYIVTGFKSKGLTLTLTSANYDVTVSVKGYEGDKLFNEYLAKKRDLDKQMESEELEEVNEEE